MSNRQPGLALALLLLAGCAPADAPPEAAAAGAPAVTLTDLVKNNELWKDEALTRTVIYIPNATGAPATEADARAEALRGLAGDMIARTLEPW